MESELVLELEVEPSLPPLSNGFITWVVLLVGFTLIEFKFMSLSVAVEDDNNNTAKISEIPPTAETNTDLTISQQTPIPRPRLTRPTQPPSSRLLSSATESDSSGLNQKDRNTATNFHELILTTSCNILLAQYDRDEDEKLSFSEYQRMVQEGQLGDIYGQFQTYFFPFFFPSIFQDNTIWGRGRPPLANLEKVRKEGKEEQQDEKEEEKVEEEEQGIEGGRREGEKKGHSQSAVASVNKLRNALMKSYILRFLTATISSQKNTSINTGTSASLSSQGEENTKFSNNLGNPNNSNIYTDYKCTTSNNNNYNNSYDDNNNNDNNSNTQSLSQPTSSISISNLDDGKGLDGRLDYTSLALQYPNGNFTSLFDSCFNIKLKVINDPSVFIEDTYYSSKYHQFPYNGSAGRTYDGKKRDESRRRANTFSYYGGGI